jgi:predicted nucleic acid-binding protein
MTTTALLDTSVWIPYLRSGKHSAAVDAWLDRGRAWLHGVALLELHAGARSIEDRRDIDAIRHAAHRLGRLYDPTGDDFCLAGIVLADHARRTGAVRPRDHSHDLLIAIGAARTSSALLTANAHDMRRWADALRRRSLTVRVLAV